MNAQLPHPEQKTPLQTGSPDPPISRPKAPVRSFQPLWLKRNEQIAFSSLWVLVIIGCAWYFLSDRGFETIDIDQLSPESVEFRVEINSASALEFSCLPGIGSITANRIIQWRSENGPFESVESLTSVPGISSKMFDALAPWLDCEAGEIPPSIDN